MARPHIAAVLENAFFGSIESVLRSRGWQERLIGYTGYGTPGQARVFARVLLSREEVDVPKQAPEPRSSRQAIEEADLARRGWRAFFTAPAAHAPVRIRLGAVTQVARTDRGGYIDAVVPGHGLQPGWHEAHLTVLSGDMLTTQVLVVPADLPIGVVSDIDDTVMVTHLPRPMIAAWNTFVRSEQAREEVPGMATMYRSFLSEVEDTPIFYLSTGAWNTAPTLTRFLRRHAFPPGPLLLTDWGPTNTGWFRSGREHKAEQLGRLAREFPQARWILVGDDGQHDPQIYGDFAVEHPDKVEAVGIRQLTPAQQVLSHGLPIATDELLGKRHGGVPMLRAPDGYTLHTLVQSARQRMGRLQPSSWVPQAEE